MLQLKYKYTDSGNCRVYFKQGKQLYCLQPSFSNHLALMPCSNDGEPISQIANDYTLSNLPFSGTWSKKEVEDENWELFLARFK